MGIVERYNKTFQEQFYSILDAYDLLDSSSDIIELEDLPSIVNSIVEDFNNSVTRLLGITPAMAIKKKNVFAKPSKPRKGPMGYDEERLSYNDSVIYLLEPSEYKGGKRRATDMNWSSKIYQIRESLIQKNQPVLYWLIDNEGNGPERSFVREELQIVPPDVEYPPQWVLSN
jgi:PAS domain-containing protein